MPTNINLPANLPENWQAGQIVSPSGTEVGLSAQHGYNYLMQQVNDTQEAANALSQAVDAQEEAQAQLETDVETLQTDVGELQTDVGELQTDVGELQTDIGNLKTGQGQLATPNATATHSDSVVAITAPAGVNLISFYAPSDFSGDDTYTVNGSAVTLTDLNGNAIYDGWKEGAPVQMILKGAQAFFKSGGGVNDTLPPINPNMTGELADGVFTVTADKLPVAQADALAGAEWYYGDHVPARPGDGTKVEFTREQLITGAPEGKAASEYNAGDIVTIKENGSPVEFICLKHGYPTQDNGMTLFLRKDISYAFTFSGMFAPYNGNALDIYFQDTYFPLFSASVRDMIQAVDIQVAGSTINRKVFALSATELGYTGSRNFVEGSAIAYFTDDDTRKATYQDSPGSWLTRSQDTGNSTMGHFVNNNGAVVNGTIRNVMFGTRPSFCLPSTALFDPDTNELIEDASGVQTLAAKIPAEGATVQAGDISASTSSQKRLIYMPEKTGAASYIVLDTNNQNSVIIVREKGWQTTPWRISGDAGYEDSTLDNLLQSYPDEYLDDSTKGAFNEINWPVNGVQTPRKCIQLSLGEIGLTFSGAYTDGEVFPFFSNPTNRVCYNDEAIRIISHWTRNYLTVSPTNAVMVNVSGEAQQQAKSTTTVYARPMLALKRDALLSPRDDGDYDFVGISDTQYVTLSIPWAESGYCYCRQFPYNSKHQYQTQLVGAVATNDPDYGSDVPALPEFEYTGTYQLLDDGDGNWRIKFTTSGTLTMAKTTTVDVFLVGGGASGGGLTTDAANSGGGGGYTQTYTSVVLEAGTEYPIVIGAGGIGVASGNCAPGGATTAFGNSVSGANGKNGGSGGGSGNKASRNSNPAGAGGSDGGNGGTFSITGGTGQGTTTREFGEPDGELYSGGGGGASYGLGDTRKGGNGGAGGPSESGGLGGTNGNGSAPSDSIGGGGGTGSASAVAGGGGGGGGYGGGGGQGLGGMGSGTGGNGFQGIAIIRNHKEAAS